MQRQIIQQRCRFLTSTNNVMNCASQQQHQQTIEKQQQVKRRRLHSNPRRLEQLVRRKMKQGIDRFEYEGKDPADSFKNGWRLSSSLILERYPVIIPDQHPFEYEYLKEKFLTQQRQSIPIPKEAFLTERDRLEGRKDPLFNDPLAAQYKPAPRRTKADEINDKKSLQRALDERLYFIIKSNEKSKNYHFPQIIANDDNISLWDYSKKAFHSIIKTNVAEHDGESDDDQKPIVHFINPRPACHLQYVFPVDYQQKFDVYGIKIFFYRAVLLNGEINKIKNAFDYLWARECELEHLLGKEYFKGIEGALYGVGPSNDIQV